MPLLPLIAAAVFVSALLLFLVQPMFARMVLPAFGGSPQVWVTCMVFFQLSLLAGYAYAHGLTRFRSLGRQTVVHILVLLLPLLFLPIAPDIGAASERAQHPQLALLTALLFSVGVPFFAVSTTGPLLQRWFSQTRHPHAGDPYFLYAASNVGSIVGLLLYPFLIEPWLRLGQQGRGWGFGYLLLLGLTVLSAVVVHRNGREPVSEAPADQAVEEAGVGWKRSLRWVALAFVPSSLMLGVTTHITTEIAVVPLLWVVPLVLYLLSFVVVFARRPLIPHRAMILALPPAALILLLLLVTGTNQPTGLALTVHLAFFMIAALVCHGELAADRPAVRHLTLFYLLLAVGGALGGVFNALLAPVLFDSLVEYPIAVILACLLCPPRSLVRRLPSLSDALPAVGIVFLTGALWWLQGPVSRGLGLDSPAFDVLRTGLVVGLPLIGCYVLVENPTRFGLALGAWCVAGLLIYEQTRGDLLHRERSFFGVHRVSLQPVEEARILRHGFTAHGMQKTDPALRRTATTYYHASGPAGQVFRAFDDRLERIGLVGLGAGTLAALGRPGQSMVFYEIDPVVIDIAENDSLFTFLGDARDRGVEVDVILGDARLSLEDAPDGHFDLLVLDAFTNDAIPVHLLTREALDLYGSKLKPDGLLLIHASNEHLAVERPIADLAFDRGLFAVFQDNPVESEQQQREGKFRSQWALLVRDRATLDPIGEDARRWRILEPGHGRVWTDDYSNIVRLMLDGPGR